MKLQIDQETQIDIEYGKKSAAEFMDFAVKFLKNEYGISEAMKHPELVSCLVVSASISSGCKRIADIIVTK